MGSREKPTWFNWRSMPVILHQIKCQKDAFQCKAGSCSSASGHAEERNYSAIKVALGKSSRPCEKVRWFQVGHLPLPRIEIYSLLGKFGGTKFFSALDLAAGFRQIWMHQKKMAYMYTFQALL